MLKTTEEHRNANSRGLYTASLCREWLKMYKPAVLDKLRAIAEKRYPKKRRASRHSATVKGIK